MDSCDKELDWEIARYVGCAQGCRRSASESVPTNSASSRPCLPQPLDATFSEGDPREKLLLRPCRTLAGPLSYYLVVVMGRLHTHRLGV